MSEADDKKFSNIIPIIAWINYYITDEKVGFKKESFHFRWLRFLLNFIINYIQSFLGEIFYIKTAYDFDNNILLKQKYLIKYLIDQKIIQNFRKINLMDDRPQLPSYIVDLSPITTISNRKIYLHGSLGGSGISKEEAINAALGETIERHARFYWNDKFLLSGSYKTIYNKNYRIDFKDFNFYSNKQLLNKSSDILINENSIIKWYPVKSLINNNEYFVPAQFIFFGLQKEFNEPFIKEVNTSGGAAGSSFEHAIYRSIMENIERDSLLIYWLNKIVPKKIELASVLNPVT